MLQRLWDGLLQRVRGGAASGSRDTGDEGASPPRDFGAEREDARQTHMSAEDRAWEAASRQRDQDTPAPGATPADPAPSSERQDR
jgi:hypothetical protein